MEGARIMWQKSDGSEWEYKHDGKSVWSIGKEGRGTISSTSVDGRYICS